MHTDTSWSALLQPGNATTFFENFPTHTLAAGNTYSIANALWLAELSRLIYRQSVDEATNPIPSVERQRFLTPVGLREANFFYNKQAQAALIRGSDGSGNNFHVLVFRGTDDVQDWFTNLEAFKVGWSDDPRKHVHEGFQEALQSIWPAILDALGTSTDPLIITGHSLGAAMATLAAASLIRKGRAVASLYTFGCPRVGDRAFANLFVRSPSFRHVNHRDIVTAVPPGDYAHIQACYYISRAGRMIAKASPAIMHADQDEDHADMLERLGRFIHFTDPPEFMSDHAPINYAAKLWALSKQQAAQQATQTTRQPRKQAPARKRTTAKKIARARAES